MANNAANSTPFYQPADKIPLPPKNAEVITTCCDYCSIACGFKVYRWPVGAPDGGPKKIKTPSAWTTRCRLVRAAGLDRISTPRPSGMAGCTILRSWATTRLMW